LKFLLIVIVFGVDASRVVDRCWREREMF